MFRLSHRALLSLHPKAVLTAIVVAVTALGTSAFGAMTLFDYLDTLDRAEHDARQAAAVLEGHATAVLESGASAVTRVADRMEGGGLSRLAEDALGEALATAGIGTQSIGALSIVDASGRVVFGPTIGLGAGAMTAILHDERPDDERGILLLPGHVDDGGAIVLARRLTDRSGRADGAVLLALPTSALSPVMRVFGDGHHRFAALLRPDGLRLTGFGEPHLGALPPVAPGDDAVESDWPVGGQAAVLGMKRMNRLPVVAAVALSRDAVLAPWYNRLERGAAVVGLSVLALLGLSWLGWASQRREATARQALQDANSRLEQRVEERTADLLALNQKLVRALTEKERANQAKGRFLSAANHDLRQPFQALRLFHHILTERLKDPRDLSIAGKMGEALDSGEKLLHALLEVATLDAGVVRPNVADVPIATVLNEAAADVRPAVEEKGLELRVRPSDAVVRTDRTLLTRMLRELLRNAATYTPSGGIVIGCRRRGQWLRVEVWDTGPGIPSEHLDAIFEDFVQLGNPERDRRHGLGLGLAKVRRKAELLGHAMEVRSRLGHGAVFTITLPLAASEAKAEPVAIPAAGPADAAPERLILVVEDDPVQRTGMQLLLESWGNRVILAADGPAALDALRAAPRAPDVIVTDFRLPGALTGAQIVTRAAEELGRPIPGIILTGDTAPERIREAMDAGCRLLHKPFTPGLLRDALSAAGTERGAARQAAHQSAA